LDGSLTNGFQFTVKEWLKVIFDDATLALIVRRADAWLLVCSVVFSHVREKLGSRGPDAVCACNFLATYIAATKCARI